MRSDKVSNYSSMMKLLHWTVAVLVIIMLAVSFFLGDLPKSYKPTAFMLHKSTGILILALMLWRLFVALTSERPKLPESVSKWEDYLSRLVQIGFYFFLIIMPLSGWIMSVAANKVPSFYGLFNLSLPGIPQSKALSKFMVETHEVIAWVLISLLVLHVLGAIKHHFIDKDGVLKSMLPFHK